MTKLMFCGDCGDVVAPSHTDMNPKWCRCERHAVWWRDGQNGLISVHDRMFPERNGSPGGTAWIIGIHNGILTEGGRIGDPNMPKMSKDGTKYLDGNCRTRAEDIERLIEETPDSYQFKTARSMIVRIYPGYSSDSKWEAVVPPEVPPTGDCGKCGMKAGNMMAVFCTHKWCTLREKGKQ